MNNRIEERRESRASFARWSKDGRRDRYVPADTMCWFPRLPHRLRARREGFETVLRCGDCPGCREFEVLRLERRLVETYREASTSTSSSSKGRLVHLTDLTPGAGARLCAVRIYAPREIHASMNRLVHRWRGVEVEPGFFRAGLDSFFVLSRSPAELGERLRRRKVRFRVLPIGKLDRLKSWRIVAIGLLVARSAYGENINRYYRRGLAELDKLNWEVIKIANYQTYHRERDPRATSEERGVLMPPAMWELRRGVRLRVHNVFRRATNPEMVASIVPGVRELISKIGRPIGVSAVPITDEQIERNRRAFQHVARQEAELSINAKPSAFPPPPFLEEVTEVLDNSSSFEERKRRSFEEMSRAPPTVEAWMEEEERRRKPAEQASRERSDRILKKKLHDAIARLRELVERRKNE